MKLTVEVNNQAWKIHRDGTLMVFEPDTDPEVTVELDRIRDRESSLIGRWRREIRRDRRRRFNAYVRDLKGTGPRFIRTKMGGMCGAMPFLIRNIEFAGPQGMEDLVALVIECATTWGADADSETGFLEMLVG